MQQKSCFMLYSRVLSMSSGKTCFIITMPLWSDWLQRAIVSCNNIYGMRGCVGLFVHLHTL